MQKLFWVMEYMHKHTVPVEEEELASWYPAHNVNIERPAEIYTDVDPKEGKHKVC